jgi:hypothetical protein
LVSKVRRAAAAFSSLDRARAGILVERKND